MTILVEVLKKELSMEFDAAVEHVQKIVVTGGFSVLMVKAMDEMLKKKLGIKNHPRYTTIMACGPKLAKMALDVSFNVGLLFPCSFVVYVEDTKVFVSHISIMKAAVEIGLASEKAMKAVIAETGKMVHAVWDKF